MEFFSTTKKNEILLFTGKWMELENIILSEVSQAQKAKNHMLSSYTDYRPKTNAAISWDIGHTKGRTHTGGIGKGKENKNLNDAYCTGMNIEILNWFGLPWEVD
jgi:hypothetical protein